MTAERQIKRAKSLVIVALVLGGAALGWVARTAHGQIAVRNQGFVPFSEAPINYRTAPVSDPVYKLQQRLERGEVKLTYEPGRGYLKSVLELLDIPVNSQSLVFSKTSFQFRKISPQTPRALYFNDDVYVGWVKDGKALELISFDPNQGAIFYILDEQKVEKPAFERAELDCTQCHVVAATRNVPGVLFRALSALALRDIDLNKIESRPFKGRRWEYLFYVDFLGHTDEPAVRNALSHLRELSDMLKVLGCYPRGD